MILKHKNALLFIRQNYFRPVAILSSEIAFLFFCTLVRNIFFFFLLSETKEIFINHNRIIFTQQLCQEYTKTETQNSICILKDDMKNLAICIRAYPTIDFITTFFFLYNSLGKRTEKKKKKKIYVIAITPQHALNFYWHMTQNRPTTSVQVLDW